MNIEPEFDALYEGIAPGGLRNKDDIMLLILYMLMTVNQNVKKSMIGKVMQEHGIANYFEVMDGVSKLASSGNIEIKEEDGEEILILTEIGEEAVSIVKDDLPKTVREIAVKDLLKEITIEKNANENTVKIEKEKDGYIVSFFIKDEETEFMNLKLYVASRNQAEILKKNFLENPEKIYSEILGAVIIE